MGVLVASLAIHIAAIAIFGTIKIVSEILREEQTFEAPPIAPPPQVEPEYTVNIQRRNQSTPPPRPPAIVVNNPSELDIPALDIDVNVDSSSVYGRGGGGFGGGLAGIREMALDAKFFGNEVTGKLGVVFDISPSTHRHILSVIDELERNFAAAPTVCVAAAGFRRDNYKDYPYQEAAEKYNVFSGQWAKTNPKLSEKIQKALKQRESVYAAVGSRLGNHGDTDSNLTAGVKVLMKRERCEEIYIFSDFADGSQQDVMEALAKEMSRKGIKLNALVLGDGSRAPAYLKEMCESTGGKMQLFKP